LWCHRCEKSVGPEHIHTTANEKAIAPVSPAQKFFDDLRVAARAPGYGDQARAFVTNLLLRAQESNLYTPPENP
jgi:hypothetical protein